ncbi:MAG: hypothetical protein R3F18_15510 [Lysobacterales bacterium]|nr:hypothetical protein [Xanthomonadales bacterium]MCB1611294.1 hypothetical protein [Xanthomonadales bacterium]
MFRRISLCLGLVALQAHAAPSWQPFVEPYNQLFPSLEIATATLASDPDDADPAVLGDQQGLIGVELSGAPAGARFELVVRVPGLARDSRLAGTIPDLDQSLNLAPTMAWDFPALAAIRQPRPANIEFELSLDGQSLGTRIQRVRVRSVNDALYYIDEEGEDDDLDFNWLFAAYVNEDHPAVDAILKEALDSGVVDQFDGYQSEDADSVLKQVYAIWHVLQQRGIRYSSITRTASTQDKVLSQHVRFIDESLAMTQANCVDGSVLIASVLRKIDIDPVLVLVPGHMLLGFALDAEGSEMAYLETTMLGDVQPKAEDVKVHLKGRAGLSVDLEASLANFEAALSAGQEQIDEAGNAFDDEDNADYQIIDIEAAREYGVMPITR